MSELTADQVRAVLHYDEATGVLTWREGTKRAGRVAGCRQSPENYIRIWIGDRLWLAHRLAWLYVTGEWPPYQIDHKNGRGDDNRLVNLRPASHSENKTNSRRHKNNTSGYKGAMFHKGVGAWRGRISKDGKRYHLGTFATAEDAHAAYVEAAKRLHGAFAKTA